MKSALLLFILMNLPAVSFIPLRLNRNKYFNATAFGPMDASGEIAARLSF